MSTDRNDEEDQRVREDRGPDRPDVSPDGLPPAAHPPARPEEPKPLDDMKVPALTEPEETEGG